MLAAGVATFVASYGATIGVNYGVCAEPATWRGCDSRGLAFIPVAGSLILAGTPDTEASYRVLAVTLGLTQALGLVLFGMSFTATSGERPQAAYFLPFASHDGGGATVAGHF